MVNKAAEIIDEIKEREKKGFLRSRQRSAQDSKPESFRTSIMEFPFHIQNSLKLTGEFKVLEEVDSIIISGVGTNAVAGFLLESYLAALNTRYPVRVIRDHYLPPDVDSKTLVFIISHSGNEEEPMLCYRNALRKGCRILGITSGGNLKESFTRNNIEHIIVPSHIMENASLPYMFFIMLRVLENSNLVPQQKDDIEDTIAALKKPEYREMAKMLSDHCKNKIPLIYTANRLSSVSRRWKNQLNRVAKSHAFVNIYTDLCYNELDAFTAAKKDSLKDNHIIILRDADDDKYIVKSINVSKNILKNKGCSMTEILIKGKNPLSKLISAVYIGDTTAYYLSEEYGLEPFGESLVAKYRKDYKNAV